MDENTFIGVGRLTRDPVLVPAGRRGEPHVTFTLAMNRVVADSSGPRTDYAPMSLWGDEAIRFAERCQKGDEVAVIARFRSSNVDKGNGERSLYLEFRVEEIEYGRKSMANLSPKPVATRETDAVGKLSLEFKGE